MPLQAACFMCISLLLLMPKRYNSLVLLVELHHLSTSSSFPPTSKMKINKASEFLKKAITAFKSKTSALKARLLILASLRRTTAMVGAISHKIHALVSGLEKARVDYGKALVPCDMTAVDEKPANDDHIDHSELALFLEDEDYPDWTHSLFDLDDNDDSGDEGGHQDDDDHDMLEELDVPSVIDIIRKNREVDGLEFNIEDEIDHAADMFIRRFRKQMNRSTMLD